MVMFCFFLKVQGGGLETGMSPGLIPSVSCSTLVYFSRQRDSIKQSEEIFFCLGRLTAVFLLFSLSV